MLTSFFLHESKDHSRWNLRTQNAEDNPSKDLGLDQYGSD